jgi:hypothetical protein
MGGINDSTYISLISVSLKHRTHNGSAGQSMYVSTATFSMLAASFIHRTHNGGAGQSLYVSTAARGRAKKVVLILAVQIQIVMAASSS